MKKILFFCAICFCLSTINAQSKSIRVNSSIKNVTVFMNGAQVTRTAGTTLASGIQNIIFEDLPADLNPNSIQVSGTGDFTILSVTPQINYLKEAQNSKETRMLKDSIESLKAKISKNEVSISVLKDEEALLKANQKLGGDQTGVKVEELKAATELFRSRFSDIRNTSRRLEKENQLIQETIQKLENQLRTIQQMQINATYDITIAVSASATEQARLSISYIVNDAGWEPIYDLRATDITQPVNLTYKAKVRQYTREDWNNVKLTLATGNPSESGSKPELMPWYIDFLATREIKFTAPTVMYDEEVSVNEKDQYKASAAMSAPSLRKAKSSAVMITEHNNQTNTEFVIETPYTIPSDNQPYTVEIKNATLPATYEYYCAPKLDADAFLLARITNWDELNLLAGQANLYFEGTYIGQSYINPTETTDTLSLSLGRDKNIVITRTRQKDYTAKQWIGNTKKDTRSFEIAIRNRKKQAINLVLEDQVPVSSNKEIEVETKDLSDGSLNKETGKVVWKLALQPSDNKKIKLTYTVSYPKDKKIILE
jgi:uncharacterized protein (TIGR02231 family)